MRIQPPVLAVKGISRAYGTDSQWFAVREASLTVLPGEFIAIVGRSGSGKSTLLNVIALLDTKWDGLFEIDGLDVKTLSATEMDGLRGRTFGFVFQSSYANPYETTSRNAALGLAIQGTRHKEQGARVSKALALVGLSEKSGNLARSLSGGERQRLAIARAIATEPSVIVADEPTGNLDSETGTQVMEVLRQLNASGTTVILVTHDSKVADYADRVISMRDGFLEEVRSGPIVRVGERTDTTSARSRGTNQPSSLRVGSRFRQAAERALRAINNVTSRPLRSVALIAAFALAFAGLIGAAGIGSTASHQIADRLSAAARDEVRINVSPGTSKEDRTDWARKLRDLSHVKGVGEIASVDATIARTSRFALLPSLTGSPFPGSTIAGNSALFDVLELQTKPATASQLFDSPGHEHVAVVGRSVAESLGLGSGGVGAEVWINGEAYSIVGTIETSPREPVLLSSVVVPIQGFLSTPSQLIVRTSAGYSGPMAKAIPLALSPAAPGDVSVESASELRNLRVGVQTDLNGLLGSVAAALLALAILSGASAMYLSVQSRTQELALSRALGLGQKGVASIFLWEGAVIGLAGALAGVAGGLGISVAVAAARGWTAVAPWQMMLLAPLAGALCGALAAIFPAVRAARIDPAEAIR